MARRTFGSIRKLPSGRWQASYWWDGRRHVAERPFATKAAASAWLSTVDVAIASGQWIDPDGGSILFEHYARQWLAGRHDLRPRTVELYDYLLRLYLLPTFGQKALNRISTMSIRHWHAGLAAASPSRAAKSYRLLRTILGTAVEDGLVGRNPCVLKGVSTERPMERQIATVEQVMALAEAVAPRYKALILTATFCSLRWGELVALTRRRLDLDHRIVSVREQYLELADGSRLLGPPKTEAGKRTVTIPSFVATELEKHCASWVDDGPDSLLFPAPEGGPWRRSNFNRRVFRPAARLAQLPDGFRFHDLRHTGNTLAAGTGASTRELMARMGHSSAAAALLYQHATRARDQAIADALDQLIERVETGDRSSPSASRT